jgi:hypothetical protein
MDVRVIDVDVGDAARVGLDPIGSKRREEEGVAMRWWKTEAEWPADEVGSAVDEIGLCTGVGCSWCGQW